MYIASENHLHRNKIAYKASQNGRNHDLDELHKSNFITLVWMIKNDLNTKCMGKSIMYSSLIIISEFRLTRNLVTKA